MRPCVDILPKSDLSNLCSNMKNSETYQNMIGLLFFLHLQTKELLAAL